MTSGKSSSATAAARESIDRISIHQRAGVWRVALNGDFYGDYARRYWALEAAFDKADDIAASGGAATITWAVDGQQHAALYDTRRKPDVEFERAFDAPRARAHRRPPLVGESFAKELLAEAKG